GGMIPPTATRASAPCARSPSSTLRASSRCAPERMESPITSASSWMASCTISSGVRLRPEYTTSAPASRRACATTFAPRSWPSKPGFAIKTRRGTASLILVGGGLDGRLRYLPQEGLRGRSPRPTPPIAARSCRHLERGKPACVALRIVRHAQRRQPHALADRHRRRIGATQEREDPQVVHLDDCKD